MSSRARIAIAIPTYGRPLGLGALLRSLEPELACTNTPVLVLDNHPVAFASHVVQEFSSLNIAYRRLVTNGVADARNALLADATEQAVSAIVFVDDDQTVRPGWFATYTRRHQQMPQTVLTGAVHYSFGPDVPGWFIRGRFVIDRIHPDLSRLTMTGTGNTLIPMSALHGLDRPLFSSAYNEGGEDTHFFQRLSNSGIGIVFLRDAAVDEVVNCTRAAPAAVFARLTRTGRTDARRSGGSRGRLFGGGALRLAGGALRVLGTLARRAPLDVTSLGPLLRGLGYLQVAFSRRDRPLGP